MNRRCSGRGGDAAEGRVRIKHRQQSEPDAGVGGGGGDAFGELRAARVGLTVRRIVEIVELGDGAVTRLQHFDIGLRRDRLDLIGVHGQRKAVHGLAPRPERIFAVAAPLGEPRHRALESVAVHIGERRQAERVALVAGFRRNANVDRVDPRASEGDANVRAPTLRRQRAREMQDGHARSLLLDPNMSIH